MQRMELGAPDDSGRRSPVPLEGSEYEVTADAVIMAVSQVPVLKGLEALDHKGNWLVADAEGAVGENIVAGGDALGPGIAGEAIVQGRRAAEALHSRLQGLEDGCSPDLVAEEIHGDQVRFATKDGSAAVHTPMPARSTNPSSWRKCSAAIPAVPVSAANSVSCTARRAASRAWRSRARACTSA